MAVRGTYVSPCPSLSFLRRPSPVAQQNNNNTIGYNYYILLTTVRQTRSALTPICLLLFEIAVNSWPAGAAADDDDDDDYDDDDDDDDEYY